MRKLCNAFFVETDDWFDRHISVPFGLGKVENSIGLCSSTDTIAQTIRELSTPRIADLPSVRLVGAIVDEADSDIDFERYRPYCYVSLGTSPWSIDELLERYRLLAREVAGKVGLVIGLGGLADADMLAIDDERVVVFQRAPQIAAIEHAEFVICHGGCQSVHEALYFGKPLIGIPHHAEIHEMVNRVELAGAGIRIAPAKLNAETIGEAVARVTAADTVNRAAAIGRRLRAEDGHANAVAVFENIEQRLRE
jgi:UDP:flavonoid glycosyltransferase YjiC (YdhE family)